WSCFRVESGTNYRQWYNLQGDVVGCPRGNLGQVAGRVLVLLQGALLGVVGFEEGQLLAGGRFEQVTLAGGVEGDDLLVEVPRVGAGAKAVEDPRRVGGGDDGDAAVVVLAQRRPLRQQRVRAQHCRGVQPQVVAPGAVVAPRSEAKGAKLGVVLPHLAVEG